MKLVQILPLMLLWAIPLLTQAQSKESNENAITIEHNEHKFDIKNFLFGHISNDYEFHISEIGELQLVVPLPIIAKSEDRGWFVFMSSRFNHKTEAYNGFSICKTGANKGLLIETLSDGSEVRPIDISITKNVFSILITTILMLVIFVSMKKKYSQDPLKTPSGLQAILEPVIIFIKDDIAKPSIGEGYQKYVPYLLTIFFFILTLNISGLIPLFPFGANVTGNINFTGCLAICTFGVTMFSTTKYYWIEKLWTPGVPVWLKVPIPLMPIVEIITIFTGPIALAVRLFANMLSGHMVVLVLIGLIFIFSSLGPVFDGGISIMSIIFSIFVLLLDVLVAFIQAYVFTLLSALYFGGARAKHH